MPWRKRCAMGVLWLLAAAGSPRAQMDAPSLRSAPISAKATAVQYCREKAEYRLTLADGSTRAWPELSVMLKLDGTDQGPAAGSAVWLPARGPGDRILVIFASLEDLKRIVQPGC